MKWVKRLIIFNSLAFLFFLVSGILLIAFAPRVLPVDRVARNISDKLAPVIARNSTVLLDIAKAWQNKSKFKKVTDGVYYITTSDSLLYWSDNSVQLPQQFYSFRDAGVEFARLGSGDYLIQQSHHESFNVVLAIPLTQSYRIQNSYLPKSWNTTIFGRYQPILRSANEDGGAAVVYNGSALFSIALTANATVSDSVLYYLGIALVCVALFILISILYTVIGNFKKHDKRYGFLMLVFVVIGIRFAMITSGFPAQFINHPVFDPKNFASSVLNPSIGDLLLNAIGVLIITIYVFRYYISLFIPHRAKSSEIADWLLSCVYMLFLFFGILFPFVVVQTVYNNSALTFSITSSLSTDSVRIIAWIAILISWISSFLFCHVFLRLAIRDYKTSRFLSSLTVAIVVFSIINESTGQYYLSALLTALLFLLLVLLFRLYKTLSRFSYLTFVYMFCGVLCAALVSGTAVEHFERIEKREQQLRFASNFLIERDYLGEYLLFEVMEKIKGDVFTQNRLISPFLSKDPIRQKISQYLMPGYFNRYSLDIYLFNASGNPADNRTSVSFDDLRTIIHEFGDSTDYDNLYLIETPDKTPIRQYVGIISIQRGDLHIGHVILSLSLRRVIPESVYPELLVDDRFTENELNNDYSYAVFQNQRVQFSAGTFNYENLELSDLQNQSLFVQGITWNEFYHIAVEDDSGRIAIVSSADKSGFMIIADFAAWVILGLSIIFGYLLILGISRTVTAMNLLLSARIQLILNLAFFVPLIAVSVIMLSLTSRSSQEQLQDDYVKRSRNVAAQLAATLIVSDSSIENSVEEFVASTTKLTNTDVNVFTPHGKLLATSQPMIFELQMQAPLIAPEALEAIMHGQRSLVIREVIGELRYFVAYAAIQSPETGDVIGIVGLPFFQSEASLAKIQTAVLANILLIFVVLFILLLIISFFVSKWLTFPLQMITQKLKRISLLKTNQPLGWKSDDEIGIMVREYNHMLLKLNESKSQLEQTQRERAWREMAQQVAHEIKNPLTPMKLTLQQLERTLVDHDQNERLRKSIEALLTQVNTLNDIATSFSSFAKMPEPVMQAIDLVSLVRQTILLHQSAEVDIVFETSSNHVVVLADDQLLIRIISNVILNGIQATPAGRKARLLVSIHMNDVDVELRIQDFGIGIDEVLQRKIFLPHFTTKSTGSGLGLAIAKQGLEQMGGSIRFETRLNEGTVFFIVLPIKR